MTAPTRDALPPASTYDALDGPRAELARVIPRRPRVSWWLGIVIAVGFATLVTPVITADRWLDVIANVERGVPAAYTVRVPPFAGYDTVGGHTGGGGILLARGETPDRDRAETAAQVDESLPHGPIPYVAFFALVAVLAGLFTHHTRRSVKGRLLRVQLVSLGVIFGAAIVTKVIMLTTSASVLVIPVALFAMVPTLVLDRVVGLATGTLAALVVTMTVPFDVGVAVMLLVQAGAAGLVIAERPKKLLRPPLMAGVAVTLFTAATYPLMLYLTTGRLPLDELRDPLQSSWLASAIGPVLATLLAPLLVPAYQLLVGEITHGKLVELEDLSNPLLTQIASKAPGTWQHSLTMANMAEIAANAIGANGRLVRVGAYYHDLGKSLQPKYFIENLEAGETSPHDKLPPEVSCDAIFAHVTEGIVAARRAGLHERIIDFMHMHHGNGVLEYFWGKTKEQGNPKGLSVEHFRYPGVPPQSRETAILSICDAVEAASRTLKKPEVSAIDNLVQRIVYGKLHLGQLDDSGLSMAELRRITESLRETIRHANHGRIEYPWQKAQQDASAPAYADKLTQTGPRLDSLDRPARPDSIAESPQRDTVERIDSPEPGDASTRRYPKADIDEVIELRPSAPKLVADPGESMPRVTNPLIAVPQRPSDEALRFVTDAQSALTDASKDLSPVARSEARSESDSAASSKDIEIVTDAMPSARTKAATLPPIKPKTTPPPLGRRSPTLPPIGTLRPPTPVSAANLTVPPPTDLRPPAPAQVPLPGVTAPPPVSTRTPGINYLDDMITLRPTYEPRHELEVQKQDDGSIRIEPAPPVRQDEDAMITRPRMLLDPAETADPGATAPNLELPLRAPPSSPINDAYDDSFGRATPVSAPTRAELQALLDGPPDVTRQQTYDEIESLHRQARERPSQELDMTRRAPYPTAEVDESDIEAAIELAPPARRTAIGVAKKPKKE